MGFELVTAPPVEPITLAEAKAHLRVDGTDDDVEIQGMIAAARQQAEARTRRAIPAQTWDWKLDWWPSRWPFRVPRPALRGITSIKYIAAVDAATRTLTTWATTNYTVSIPSGQFAEHGRIALADGASVPALAGVIDAVEIRFDAGWLLASDVPEGLRSGMMLHIGFLYEHREEVVVGTIAQRLPIGSETLYQPFRVDIIGFRP